MGCGEISILTHFSGFCSLFSPFSSSHGAVVMATAQLQVAGPPSPLSQREKLKPSSYRSAKFLHSLKEQTVHVLLLFGLCTISTLLFLKEYLMS